MKLVLIDSETKGAQGLNFDRIGGKSCAQSIFDNLPEFITAKEASLVTRFEVKTIYDWKYRPAKYGTPRDLFLPKKRPRSKLLLRREVLKNWVNSLNA